MENNMEPWRKFEELVAEIMQFFGFSINKSKNRGGTGFDLVGRKDGEKWAIEVKHYRTARARPALVEAAAVRLVTNAEEEGLKKVILVVSSFLDESFREDLQARLGVNVLDAKGLREIASRNSVLLERLESMLVVDQFTDDLIRREIFSDRSGINSGDGILFRHMVPLERIPVGRGAPLDEGGGDLCADLHKISPGKKHAGRYEKWCERAIRYIFPNDLEGWHSQKGTEDGLNRFDLICRIKPVSDFWKFLMEHLDSRYVLFEFKNYRELVGQREVLTTEKYLFEKGLRKVALMLTRNGGNGSAIAMAQGAMREHGKLMIILDDKDLCHMLKMKDEGEDASDFLFEKADQFLVSLPR